MNDFVHSFSGDKIIQAFANEFCRSDSKSSNFFTSVLYECLVYDKPEMIQIYIEFFTARYNVTRDRSMIEFLSNLKVLRQYYRVNEMKLMNEMFLECFLVNLEMSWYELGDNHLLIKDL